ncbi:hypothetical protein [Microvirga brassicacearum]|uniref:Uncharacterized protein n=1 Tax=Microvirga brassicacearum TaxID=2580413 RepID=A0A5N3P5Q7_9HYPH|nr:hypothetical protein [Microvirga brassicacearum]KAB0265060.1 hypothetical protein FEZ63_20315 [Microvirga brassicacearum]
MTVPYLRYAIVPITIVKRLILGLAIATLSLSPSMGQETTVTLKSTGLMGCRSSWDWEKARALIVAKDNAAFGKFSDDKLKSGDCIMFLKGTEISADKMEGTSECLRVKGTVECFWSYPVVWLENAKQR